MNKKGFTLVEILAVIVILVTIGVSLILVVGKMGNNSKNDIYESNIILIKEAAKQYGNDNLNSLSNNCTNITILGLMENGYLESESKTEYVMKDPRNNTSMNDLNVCIKYNNKIEISIEGDN